VLSSVSGVIPTDAGPGEGRKMQNLTLVLEATIHGSRGSPPPPC